MLAICTLASPLTKKQQSQETETMVSLWFVQGKKKSHDYKTGGEVERVHDDELGGRVPIFLNGLGLS